MQYSKLHSFHNSFMVRLAVHISSHGKVTIDPEKLGEFTSECAVHNGVWTREDNQGFLFPVQSSEDAAEMQNARYWLEVDDLFTPTRSSLSPFGEPAENWRFLSAAEILHNYMRCWQKAEADNPPEDEDDAFLQGLETMQELAEVLQSKGPWPRLLCNMRCEDEENRYITFYLADNSVLFVTPHGCSLLRPYAESAGKNLVTLGTQDIAQMEPMGHA